MTTLNTYDFYFLAALSLLLALLVCWIVGNWQDADTRAFTEQAVRIEALEAELVELEVALEKLRKECLWWRYDSEKEK